MSGLFSYLRSGAWRQGVSPGEYRRLGLDARPDRVSDFIGAYGAARLALWINRLSNRRGLVADKLLFGATLRGAGLPAVPVSAVFGRPAPPGAERIRSQKSLRARLARPDGLPLFCKPAMGQRGGGEMAIFGYDDEADDILMLDGSRVTLAAMWKMLQDHKTSGYLFQPFLRARFKTN